MSYFFVKKLWEHVSDDSVHSQFTRFSRGLYENRAALVLTKNDKCKVSASFECANDLVQFFFSLTPQAQAAGIMLTRNDPRQMLASLGINAAVRKKSVLWEATLSGEFSTAAITALAREAYSLFLDCTAENLQLRMKKKLPQPGKSGKAKADDKFCILEADMHFFPAIQKEFAFDVPNFKKLKMTHSFLVEDIVLPANEKNPELMRLKAVRKGKVTRTLDIDGVSSVKEIAFSA